MDSVWLLAFLPVLSMNVLCGSKFCVHDFANKPDSAIVDFGCPIAKSIIPLELDIISIDDTSKESTNSFAT